MKGRLDEKRAGEICLEGVTKFYGSVCAVRDINLTVPGGSFVTLLGPSGSGKTTILMMIAGFVPPTAGEIYTDSRWLTPLPAYQRNLGVVFQSYALFPHMTVSRNVAFPLRMRGVAKPEAGQKVAKALELVRLSGYESRYPQELSGGQQQRVALARALVFDPPVLLMDEPLGALDRQLREHMQVELKHLQQQLGITVLYVTHDQEEALVMSDLVVVMNHGRIEQVGSPEEVYEAPANTFVASFLGESNFLDGEITEVRDTTCVVKTGTGMNFEVGRRREVAVGERVRVSVRPEKIRLGDPGGQQRNSYDAIVEEVIYVGSATKYRVRLHPSVELMARGPLKKAAKGDRLRVGWNPDDALLLSEGLR